MPLITTIEELKQYSPSANLGILPATFLPVFTFVEQNVIKKELGEDLYNVLLSDYQASIRTISPIALTTQMSDLLHQVRMVLAPLGMLHYKNVSMNQISDTGSQEKSSENSNPVRMWVNSLQSSVLYEEGMAAIDLLLAFLDENEGDYPDWINSDSYTRFKELLLQTTAQFNNEVFINSSRRFFRAMRANIKFVELHIIKKAIGEAFYNRLILCQVNSSYTQPELTALAAIYPVIANFAIAHSSLGIELGTDGAYTLQSQAAYSGFKADKMPVDIPRLTMLKEAHQQRGQTYLDDMKSYLNNMASATIFPEYFTSTQYTNPTTPAPPDVNEGLSNIYVL